MRIIVISDIHGRPKDVNWLSEYGQINFIKLSDLCEDPSLSGSELHSYLFEGEGLQHVVSRLKDFAADKTHGIGFSAGGTALWLAAKDGLEIEKLVCVSSTRLRYETDNLDIPTFTFWGELDPNRPSDEWCQSTPGYSRVYAGQSHNFYDEISDRPGSDYRTDIIRALTA
ncbi:alpha/beta hydrolase [uncultured Agrobacterium sp.]|uniref:alpha/beta hydrolase n=1 Tax=uncultured Agrobacterium sp. TaxID=157277 RepID=UPI00258C2F40|nr:alpha/beta hydrolase [uncultured Agrobacterium sp.]